MGAVRAHVYIEGRVQGVFYRDWTVRAAQGLRLKGWVRNMADGRVETVFEGPKKIAKEMVKMFKKGPSSANVTHIDVVWEEARGEFTDFVVKR